MIIKICGIQNKDTLLCCEKNKINFFGMIFYQKSPRNISFENARMLQNISKDLNINGVGVFVNKDIIELEAIIKNLKLKYVQLHGSEDEQYIKTLKKMDIKIIKSISISNVNDLNKIYKYESVDYFLFDYKPLENELPGGNSKSFDWDILNKINIDTPWFLSGGINIQNIQYIKTEIMPFGVDLSSGVEKELGIKDNQIINNFMEKLNRA